MAKIDNIKNLYNQLNNKQKFVHDVADYYFKNYDHIKNRWFSKWKIPEKFQVKIIEMLQNQIKNQ